MKVSGSYASLLRGVSQQAPEVRQPGQHSEQINLLSDPVQGLTRRRGTQWQATRLVSGPLNAPALDILEKSTGYRKHYHSSNGREYVFMVRERGMSGYAANSSLYPEAVICYDITNRRFLNVDPTSAYMLERIGANGIAAITSVGQFICFATNGMRVQNPAASVYTNDTAHLIAWVRAGAFDRMYKLKLADGREIAYQTPRAIDEGSATAISPQNIAQKLAESAVGQGIGVHRQGAHLFINVKMDATPTDGGDGSLLQAVYNITDNVSKLPLLAVNGQIVKVQTGPTTGFYVKAVTKTTSDPWLNETRWIETAGTVQGAQVREFYMMAIDIATGPTFGTLHIAQSPENLKLQLPVTAGIVVPQFVASTSGDAVTNPAPQWLTSDVNRNRQITYMGMFQDRFVVAAGAAVSVSAAGDYFNFYRSTVTTVPAKDPFEMVAQGSEDDTIRHSVIYNRSLTLFGDKRQYVIPQGGLSPLSATMQVMTTYADAAGTPPVAAGGQVYFARTQEGFVSLSQIQPGAYAESAEAYPASGQINTYIPAPTVQLEAIPGSPAHIALRTDGQRDSFYLFSYLDQPDGRKQEAWSRHQFGAAAGKLIGMHSTPNGLLTFWYRGAPFSATGTQLHIVADLLPMSGALANEPYFDSARYSTSNGALDFGTDAKTDAWAVAFNKASGRFLIGGKLSEVGGIYAEYPGVAGMMAGIPFESTVTLTNPFSRDGQGQAILTGRTTITSLNLSLKQSSGVQAYVTSGGFTTPHTFNARVLGDLLNQIGVIPITDQTHGIGIGRESREYTCRLASLKWYPMTIVGISWIGQSFNRTPRAQ